MDGGGGGKDWVNGFKEDAVGQGKQELPLGQCEIGVACEVTERES